MPMKSIESILYSGDFVVIDPMTTPFSKGEVISESVYNQARDAYGDEGFIALTGAEAIRELLVRLDLGAIRAGLRSELESTSSEMKRKRWSKDCGSSKTSSLPAIDQSG